MIKQADKDKAKKLGLDLDAIIKAAAEAAEVDVVIPDGEILTAEQRTALEGNMKIEGIKEGKKDGQKEALIMSIAEINKQTGLNIDPAKIERFGDLGKTIKDELSKTTDEKLKTVNQQVTDLLKDKETLTLELTTAKTTAEKTVFNYQQFQNLPENRAKNFNENEYLNMLSGRGVEIKADGVYRNGEPIKDPTTKAPLAHKDAFKTLFDEFKWTAEPPAGAAGGRGGGNSGGVPNGGKARTFAEAEKKWLDANPNGNLISPEFDAFLSSEKKDNPTFSYTD